MQRLVNLRAGQCNVQEQNQERKATRYISGQCATRLLIFKHWQWKGPYDLMQVKCVIYYFRIRTSLELISHTD